MAELSLPAGWTAGALTGLALALWLAVGCAAEPATPFSVTTDSLTAVEVSGGPPLPGPDGRIATPTRTVLVELHGSQLDPIRPQIRALLAAMGAEREWYDVGPDSGCVSVVMTLDGQRYEISSWYPLFRDRETVAVTDAGLVAVASRREKLEREGRNSPRYKTLTAFLDALVEHHAPSTTARQ